MKIFGTLLAGIAVVASVAAPAFANELRARIKTVDADKGSVTVMEGQKDYELIATADSKFLNVKGTDLVNGIKSNDLKTGRRVIVNFDNKDGKLILSSLQIRPAK